VFLRLNKLLVHLQSASPELAIAWQRLFAAWSVAETGAPEPSFTSFELQLVSELPESPSQSPLFRHPDGLLEVYSTKDQETILSFPGAAHVSMDVQALGRPIHGSLTLAGLRREQLEDITLTCLAPRLRRMGDYLVHAAALSRTDEAILLVGPSGSGKTTTALNLALNGWKLLANDAVLLTVLNDNVSALATPGDIRLRAGALGYLPLSEVMVPLIKQSRQATIVTRQGAFSVQASAQAPVRRIYFLSLADDHRCRLSPEQPAIALARLCEQSVDRWDGPALAAHLDFLQRLSRQASSYHLELGSDISELADLLAAG
jgi:hypothetical protein